MSSTGSRHSWFQTIVETAKQQGIELPTVSQNAMGVVVWQSGMGDRAISLKHRLLPLGQDADQAILWTLWQTTNEVRRIASVYEHRDPTANRVATFLKVLVGWLVDRASVDAIKDYIQDAVVSTEITSTTHSDQSRISLDECGAISFNIGDESWQILSYGRSLTQGRVNQGRTFDCLERNLLDHFVSWLSKNWNAIAYGIDARPIALQEGNASACKAYEYGRLKVANDSSASNDLENWWARHALRAASDQFPNLFFERQEDDLVISWDSIPASGRTYQIHSGIEMVPLDVAVPALRSIAESVAGDSEAMSNHYPGASAGLEMLKHYHQSQKLSKDWLTQFGFGDAEAARFAIAGTSRHPVVGLLRSSRATLLDLGDLEVILKCLRPVESGSFEAIRNLAAGISTEIDPREPWESGYKLARAVRQKLGLQSHQEFSLDDCLLNLQVFTNRISLTDSSVRGACVGSPAYCPAVFLNMNCDEACGVSGSRITLAHELCHLLFDRTHMRGLARVEGGAADGDRIYEMRANAFAVELLAPMETLIDEYGELPRDNELTTIAKDKQVSFHALSRQVENLRRRLG